MKQYTRQSSITSFVKNQQNDRIDDIQPVRLISSVINTFDITKDCLHCGKPAVESKKGSNRPIDKVYTCRSLSYIDKVRKHAELHPNDDNEELSIRIANVIDLVAEDVKYHNKCRVHFFFG